MRTLIVPLLLMCACAALFSLPAVYYLDSTAVGGPRTDVWNSLWLLWVTPTAVFDSQLDLAHLSLLVDPDGVNLWPHLGNFLLPLLMSPVTLSKGPIVAFNVALIAALFLNCLFAYLFLREVVGDSGAALPPAMAFGASTFVLAEAAYGNVELAGVFVLPLAAWAVVRVCDAPQWRTAILAALALILAALWNAYYGLAAFLFAVTAVVWAAVTEKNKQTLWAGGGAVAGAGILLAPFFLVLKRATEGAAQAGGAVADGASLDLLEPLHLARDYPDTVPYFLLIVAVLALFFRRKEALFWWVGALVLFAFSLGSTIHFFGHDTGIPGPYRLLEIFPGMARARWPYRFAPMAMLCLAVPAGAVFRYGAEYLEQRGKGGETRFLSIGVLLGLAVSFFHVPHPAVAAQVPDAYGALHEFGEGAVLELPAHGNFYVNSNYLYYQTVHRRPVLIGKPLPDRPDGFSAAVLQAAPGLKPLSPYPPDHLALAEVDVAKLKSDLKALGVRYVALHENDLPDDARPFLSAWCETTFGAPLRRSESMAVYLVR